MFYLGKAFTLFLHPLTWMVLFFIVALARKKTMPRKVYYILGLLIFLSSNKVFVNTMALSLENTAPNVENELPKTAVVLGGYCSWDDTRHTINFYPAADRLFKAIELYKKGKVNTLLLTGGIVYESKKRKSEALVAKDYLMNLGIPEKDIITEPNSKSTYENAIESQKILGKVGEKGITLITSATHMPRAMACFKKQGLIVTPYSTDYKTSKSNSFVWFDYFIPSATALVTFDAVVKEWFGLLAYKITGKI